MEIIEALKSSISICTSLDVLKWSIIFFAGIKVYFWVSCDMAYLASLFLSMTRISMDKCV